MDALNQAIHLVGGPSKLLAKLKERPGREKLKLGNLWHWRKPNVPVPAEYCPDIELMTDGAVTCEQLNPAMDWELLRSMPKRTDASNTPTGQEASHG